MSGPLTTNWIHLAEQVSQAARAAAPVEQSAWAAALAVRLFAHVRQEDLNDPSPGNLAGAALSLLRFGLKRPAGKPIMRLFEPVPAADGFQSPNSIMLIVNDDMPFLVDSVTGALAEEGVGINLVLHPIISVARDFEGQLTSLDGETDTQRESWMLLVLDRQGGDPARFAELESRVHAVLADVRRAVVDWQPMVQRAREVAAELAEQSPADPAAGRANDEAAAFLNWLAADHFTFLAYRAYTYDGNGEAVAYHQVPGTGLGLMGDPSFRLFDAAASGQAVPAEVRAFHKRDSRILITKSDRPSTVHRNTPMDVIIVKQLDEAGRLAGELRFVGLFTSTAYNASPRNVPLLKGRVARVIERAGLDSRSHDGKALLHILETYPRDELFQAAEEELFETAMSILALQDRPRTSLFLRRDPFNRYVTALVYTPRDGFSAHMRKRFATILAEDFKATVVNISTHVTDEARLARVQYSLHLGPDSPREADLPSIEHHLQHAARTWVERMRQRLIAVHGEYQGLNLFRRYQDVFSLSYRETYLPEGADDDIMRIERALETHALNAELEGPHPGEDDIWHLKVYRPDEAVPLHDIMPMLENMGFRVLREGGPYKIVPGPKQGESVRDVWLHDFFIKAPRYHMSFESLGSLIEEAVPALWRGEVEDDGFNRLILCAGLGSREVALLRGYAKYLRQAGIPFSQDYMEDALAANPAIAAQLVALFAARFDPARQSGGTEVIEAAEAELETQLGQVASLDEDRILRRFRNAIAATLRTNYFQKDATGAEKAHISFKLDSAKVEGLPPPRPMVEVFVYSPRAEGIHLRGGKVARGGIRWSDRREDFRTEILGLMKAQMVKNAVIVPVGSKGGFIVKRPPAEQTREAVQQEGIACYKILISGLLDITDNLVDGTIVPPRDVVRHDDDDPYLVVAADKGTATFSDIANGLSQDYGFWLDDAFASGGSAGYDHKKMGITARGAWECVKRHFRELGHDTQSQPFTVVGVGDMSGDVFGNGMLLSDQIRLLAAFNHLHIFVDPDPDPARSFAERKRLFDLPRSSWSDYDKALISAGGGIFSRADKSIAITPQMAERFGIQVTTLTPNDLIRAILTSEADLLWFGGIGTYVKSGAETNAEAGDRANDALRIDGADLKVRVVGEGANLGVTQLGRIEAAAKGIAINTDALDNSAGVDCSDHEVNIKILLRGAITDGSLQDGDRNGLLAQMTDEVSDLVLRDNYQQSQAVSLAELTAAEDIDAHGRLMRSLEREGRLDRAVEFLPPGEEIRAREAAGRGLTRPELCVLFAYSKLDLFDHLIESDLPDDPLLEAELSRYFPDVLSDRFMPALTGHRLRREIITTTVVNSMINRVGSLFVDRMGGRTGATAAEIARAYAVARDIFDLRATWAAIEALDNQVPASAQLIMMRRTQLLLRRATQWLLSHLQQPIDMQRAVERLRPQVEALRNGVPAVLTEERRERLAAESAELISDGVSGSLAQEVGTLDDLAFALDLTLLAERSGMTAAELAPLHFLVGERLSFARLRQAALAQRQAAGAGGWHLRAVEAVNTELYALQAEITGAILDAGKDLGDPAAALETWLTARGGAWRSADALIEELRAQSNIDLAAITVARRAMSGLLVRG